MNIKDITAVLNFVVALMFIVGMFTLDITYYQHLILMGLVFILMEVTANR